MSYLDVVVVVVMFYLDVVIVVVVISYLDVVVVLSYIDVVVVVMSYLNIGHFGVLGDLLVEQVELTILEGLVFVGHPPKQVS